MVRQVLLLFLIVLIAAIIQPTNANTVSHGFERSRVAQDPDTISPLLNGQFVPDVIVKTEDGLDISLRQLVERKPTVMIFYRGGWCPYCNRQMAGLVEVEQRILDLGYQIVAVSPDTPARLKEQQGVEDFDVIRLSDSVLKATRSFGLAYYLPDDIAERYRGKLGAELVSLEGDARVVLPVPAVYVFDTSGLIQFSYVNPNHKVRVEPLLLYHAARIHR